MQRERQTERERQTLVYKVYIKNIICCSTRFVHNIEITVCTENSGDTKGKHGTSSNACERTLTNDIKQNVFIQIFLGCEKDKKFCTAQVKGNNCKKITKEAARYTLPLWVSRTSLLRSGYWLTLT